MIEHKEFFIRMCELEKVTTRELQMLTGKSKSVVYEWLDYSNYKTLPNYQAMSKIICRLGISMDELVKCKCSKLVDYNEYRTYQDYIKGDDSNQRLELDILDNPNSKYILHCYINDYLALRELIDNYLMDLNVDMEKLGRLCEYIKPVVLSDVEYAFDDFGGGALYYLNSANIIDYKDRTELFIDRIENDPEYELHCNHELIFPDIDDVLLLMSEEDINLIRKYLLITTEKERNYLMDSYCNLIEYNPDFDKDKKILKVLQKNNTVSNFSLYEVVKYVVTLKTVKLSDIQRRFNIGFGTAYEIMMRLEEEEIVSRKVDGEDRRVLMSIEEFKEKWN